MTRHDLLFLCLGLRVLCNLSSKYWSYIRHASLKESKTLPVVVFSRSKGCPTLESLYCSSVINSVKHQRVFYLICMHIINSLKHHRVFYFMYAFSFDSHTYQWLERVHNMIYCTFEMMHYLLNLIFFSQMFSGSNTWDTHTSWPILCAFHHWRFCLYRGKSIGKMNTFWLSL